MRFLEKHAGWIQTAITMGVVVALHFGDARYVAKDAYEKDQDATRRSLVDLSTAIALLQQTGKVQEDHEQRLRSLERNRLKANYEIPKHDVFNVPALRADADH